MGRSAGESRWRREERVGLSRVDGLHYMPGEGVRQVWVLIEKRAILVLAASKLTQVYERSRLQLSLP